MNFVLSLFNAAIFLSVSLRICECKSKNLFLNDQMFLKKILKFFDDLNSLFQTLNPTPALPVLPDCKDTKLFNSRNFYFQKVLIVFLRIPKVVF